MKTPQVSSAPKNMLRGVLPGRQEADYPFEGDVQPAADVPYVKPCLVNVRSLRRYFAETGSGNFQLPSRISGLGRYRRAI